MKNRWVLLAGLWALCASPAAVAQEGAAAPALFAKVASLPGRLAGLHDLALAGRWREVREQVTQELPALAGEVDTSPAPAATALALRALADAALEDGAALCRWNVARLYDPQLREADLSAYGVPGELLAKYHWNQKLPSAPEDEELQRVMAEARAAGRRLPVEPPAKLHAPAPGYTPAARAAGIQGEVVVEAIVDARGLPVNARALKGQPKGLTFVALDAICGWRFRPARFQGRPVRVYFVLNVNFGLREKPR